MLPTPVSHWQSRTEGHIGVSFRVAQEPIERSTESAVPVVPSGEYRWLAKTEAPRRRAVSVRVRVAVTLLTGADGTSPPVLHVDVEDIVRPLLALAGLRHFGLCPLWGGPCCYLELPAAPARTDVDEWAGDFLRLAVAAKLTEAHWELVRSAMTDLTTVPVLTYRELMARQIVPQ